MKHHSLAINFSYLNFEKIDTEILPNEAKELKETDAATTIEGMDVAEVGSSDPGKLGVLGSSTMFGCSLVLGF